MKNFTKALTIFFVLMFLNGMSSGKRVEAHIIVRRYSWPDLVLGKGPKQSIIILLKKVYQKQVWAVNKPLVLSGWVFLPSDKYDKIYKTEKHQIPTLASKNGSEFCDRSCLHLNDLTWESHGR